MSTTPRRAAMRRPWVRGLALACGLSASALIATAARAEVTVDGNPAALHVTTDHAAISDVLSAFAEKLNVKYRTAIALDAAAETNYAGSVGQVISRLLDGYNYVVKRDGPTTEIIVFGRRGEMAIPPREPKPIATGLMSRWR